MNAVLLRKGRSRQLAFDFGLEADSAAMERRWRNAEEGERRSRGTILPTARSRRESHSSLLQLMHLAWPW